MGVYHYIACHETREQFELGKGPWDHLDVVTPCTIDALAERMSSAWLDKHGSTDRDYFGRVASRLHPWLERVGWRVVRWDDFSYQAGEEAAEYAEIGTRHE